MILAATPDNDTLYVGAGLCGRPGNSPESNSVQTLQTFLG